jgi:hypothetical protein
MRAITLLAMSLAVSAYCSGTWAYGGGGGGPSCAEPTFAELNPGGAVAALSELSVIASDNTEIDSLTVEVNADKITPAINKRRSGDYEVKATLPTPIAQPGKVRIAINAKSKGGCWGALIRFVEVRP